MGAFILGRTVVVVVVVVLVVFDLLGANDLTFSEASALIFTGFDQGTLCLLHPSVLQNKTLKKAID